MGVMSYIAGALSDDEESMTSSDRVQSVRSDESGNESEAPETDNSKLVSYPLNNMSGTSGQVCVKINPYVIY